MYHKNPAVESWTELVEETLGIESKSLKLRQRLVTAWNRAERGSADRDLVKTLVKKLEWYHLKPPADLLKRLTQLEMRQKKTKREGQ